ncbi:MAG: tripartite tricarboxylate transporter substrate binding protein [Burkholderiales bacterium]|nr:tripartite tricarboxylate transporter substrate binding protein [Burkholderiales bacterium]
MRKSTTFLAAILLAAAAGSALAQAWPTRPVRILVGFPAGQATDVLARIAAQRMSDATGQQFFVENRPGASGNIAFEMAARAAPDGYTLLMASSGTAAINPSLYAKLPFDITRDFAPVILMADIPQLLVVNPGLPVRNVRELIDYAKVRPGRIDYASGGSGLTNHLIMEMFKSATGLRLVHIPYRGGPPALTDLIAGQVSLMFETTVGALPHVRAGKLRALAISRAKRSSGAPDVPTVAESGVPGFDAAAWISMMAPAATPREIILRVNGEINKSLTTAEMRERLTGMGADPIGGTPEEFGAFHKAELAKWAKVVKDSGAKVD